MVSIIVIQRIYFLTKLRFFLKGISKNLIFLNSARKKTAGISYLHSKLPKNSLVKTLILISLNFFNDFN
jgi:hypothetical protein